MLSCWEFYFLIYTYSIMFNKASANTANIYVYYISNKNSIAYQRITNIGKRSIDSVCLLEMDDISYWSVSILYFYRAYRFCLNPVLQPIADSPTLCLRNVSRFEIEYRDERGTRVYFGQYWSDLSSTKVKSWKRNSTTRARTYRLLPSWPFRS